MEQNNLRKLLLIAFVFSGIAALIYEITWIRPLQFIFGPTTYTISIIFGVFMAGLALGSFVISKYIEKVENLSKTYALLELGIGIYGILLLSGFSLLPGLYDRLYALHTNFYLFEIVQFAIVFLVLLIPTALMGATFPIIARVYTKEKVGKGIGEIYAANNLGAIIGSFAAGFVLIPLLGIKYTIIIACSINLLLAFSILFITDRSFAKSIIPIALSLFLILAYFGNYNMQQMHSGGFYKSDPVTETLGKVVYNEEGLYATITVRELQKIGYSFLVNGKGQGSTEILDLRVQFLLSYLPVLIKPDISQGLVVGLGTGMTSGQLSGFTNITTVEIEQKVIGATNYFTLFNRKVLENPNHTLIIDDARNYLLKNDKKYELIVQEPTDPWYQFSTNLYSKEFFELVSEDLTEDGLYVKWIPIYTMSPEDFKNVYKTFNSVFPNVVAFANIKVDENNPLPFGTSEILLIGSKNKIKINNEEINKNYNSLPLESKQYLEVLNLDSGNKIYHLLLFNDSDLAGYVDNAEVITDDNLRLEFSTARKALNQNPRAVLDDINSFIEKNA